MKHYGFRYLLVLIVFSFMFGCASTIPMTAKMSDTVMMGIKNNSSTSSAFEFQSNITDGIIKPCGKDNREPQSGHPGYSHTENATFEKMLKDYIGMKFVAIDNSSDTKLKVMIRDFWIEQYSPDSAGSQFLAVMGGGEINMVVVANLDVVYILTDNGKTVSKNIKVSSDSTHVSGIGTGTSTSRIHRGSDSIEYRVVEAINGVNSKAIIMLNQFLESNKL